MCWKNNLGLETRKLWHGASHLIVRHLWVLHPENLVMSSTAILCLLLFQADVFGNWQSIELSQVLESLVDKTATLARAELFTRICICSTFGPIALCTQPIFVQLLQEVPVSVVMPPRNQTMFDDYPT